MSWRQGIARWEQDHNAKRRELEEAIAAHASALTEHAGSIGRHEEDLVQHEHFIAECEKTGRSGGDAEKARGELPRVETGRLPE